MWIAESLSIWTESFYQLLTGKTYNKSTNKSIAKQLRTINNKQQTTYKETGSHRSYRYSKIYITAFCSQPPCFNTQFALYFIVTTCLMSMAVGWMTKDWFLAVVGIFLFTTSSLLTNWYHRPLYPGVQWLEQEGDYSLPSNAEFKTAWRSVFTPTAHHHNVVLRHRDNFLPRLQNYSNYLMTLIYLLTKTTAERVKYDSVILKNRLYKSSHFCKYYHHTCI